MSREIKSNLSRLKLKTEKLRIYTWPDKILKKKCKKVIKVDDYIRSVFDEMLMLMRVYKGIGLAANQTGLDLRLVVIEIGDRIFKLVNPSIAKKEGSVSFCEGCLSFPGLEIDVPRSDKIWVTAQDEQGEPLKLEIEGILSVIFQHEIDHLNGITFIERISFLSRLKATPRLKQISRRTRSGMSKQEKES